MRPRIPQEMLERISPPVADALRTVPERVLDLYGAVEEVSWIKRPGTTADLIEIASSGSTESLCVDSTRGEVVELRWARPERSSHRVPEPASTPVNFVNSSPALLIRSLACLQGVLPDYAAADDEEHWERVADVLERCLQEIDPPATAPNTFWTSIIEDVSMGYFYACDAA